MQNIFSNAERMYAIRAGKCVQTVDNSADRMVVYKKKIREGVVCMTPCGVLPDRAGFSGAHVVSQHTDRSGLAYLK